jgi:hypothetical protein
LSGAAQFISNEVTLAQEIVSLGDQGGWDRNVPRADAAHQDPFRIFRQAERA